MVVLARLLTQALWMALDWKAHSTLVASLNKISPCQVIVVAGGSHFGCVWLALPAQRHWWVVSETWLFYLLGVNPLGYND